VRQAKRIGSACLRFPETSPGAPGRIRSLRTRVRRSIAHLITAGREHACGSRWPSRATLPSPLDSSSSHEPLHEPATPGDARPKDCVPVDGGAGGIWVVHSGIRPAPRLRQRPCPSFPAGCFSAARCQIRRPSVDAIRPSRDEIEQRIRGLLAEVNIPVRIMQTARPAQVQTRRSCPGRARPPPRAGDGINEHQPATTGGLGVLLEGVERVPAPQPMVARAWGAMSMLTGVPASRSTSSPSNCSGMGLSGVNP
jgi:hypothetical protein